MNKYTCRIILALYCIIPTAYALETERVNVSSIGEQANFSSDSSSISADGRYVAFQSRATNLTTDGDSNGSPDIFVHDRDTGTTERVSLSSAGNQANQGSFNPSISANGRFVTFWSRATNLVASGDSNGSPDIFVHDRNMGITERVSVSSTEEQANFLSLEPSISADGRYVAFLSRATNLVTGDVNNQEDIFVHDRDTGITELANVSSTGEQANFLSGSPSISANGRYVAFSSSANNLVAGDTNGNTSDIFVHDRDTGLTERVSVSSAGNQANAGSSSPSISADGRYVTFASFASSLVAGDANGTISDIYVHDRDTGLTERVNMSSAGNQANRSSGLPGISADGRYVTFVSDADNLVVNDTNSQPDVFVHDRNTGITERLSLSMAGEQANGRSNYSSISADGRYATYLSFANNLVLGDTNNILNEELYDVFVTNNPLIVSDNYLLNVEKLINNVIRNTRNSSAQLATGTLYKQSYKVTNTSAKRIYQVKVYEGSNLVCNFYSLDPGEIKERCISFKTVLEGDQHTFISLSAKVSGSDQAITAFNDVYYTGHNVSGELIVTHRINNINADTLDQASTLDILPASVLFKVENTGNIELYQVKAYHDPVSPVNSGWDLQCVLGPMKPGQVRYCKKDIPLSEPGLNQTMGRVQARNAIKSATDVVNASNPTYFIVP